MLESLNRNRPRNLRPPDGQEHSLVGLSTLFSHPETTKNAQSSPSSLQKTGRNLQNRTQIRPFPTFSTPSDDIVAIVTARIAEISLQMAQTEDPTKVQELSKVVRLLRRFRKNELSSRRLRLRMSMTGSTAHGESESSKLTVTRVNSIP